MIFPEDFEVKTGFHAIREQLFAECSSTLGSSRIEGLRFVSNISELTLLHGQTSEFLNILTSSQNFPSDGYHDLRSLYSLLRIPPSYADPAQLLQFRQMLVCTRECIAFLENKKEENIFPNLVLLSEGIEPCSHLIPAIDAILDEHANVKDSASPELASIRSRMNSLRRQAASRLSKIISQGIKAGHLEAGTTPTIRSGRSVIPIPSHLKKTFPGFMHDESSSGLTLFIEPAEIFSMNNEIRECEYDEKHEIIKILTNIADLIRPLLEELKKIQEFLGTLDFIRARARFALRIKAIIPAMIPEPHVEWKKARHPLLEQKLSITGKKVVPLDLVLDETSRIIIISGPNAGGKSVCLKTTALLQYMVQCGLPVPVAEGSVFGIFESILLDIGDDQSIENDLSTYSSHLHAMKCFLENANEQTLFLVDELGSGTEPRIGGALAQSMLMQLNDQEAMGLVTTHYANLKLLASSTPGIFNGAMRFDNKKMLPLFVLDTGNPGSSFAIEIARRTGIDEKILEDAQNLAGSEFFRYDSRLQDLESDQIRLGKKMEDLEKKEEFLNSLIREYESMKALNDRVKKDMEAKKKVLLNHAKTEAAEIIEKANQLVENTIKEIKESKADKIITKESRDKLEVFVKQNKPQPPVESIFVAIPEPEPAETISGQINIGDSVRIKGLFDVGEVIEMKSKKITVAFDSVKTIIQIDNLEKVKKQKTIPKKKSYVTSSLASGIQEKKAYFNPQADMRGIRAEEAYTYIQNYIDDALMLGITELTILHGKGNGVLRNIVREYLRTLSQVEWYGDENPDRGGAGITLVRLK